jgi:hypothetical protein
MNLFLTFKCVLFMILCALIIFLLIHYGFYFFRYLLHKEHIILAELFFVVFIMIFGVVYFLVVDIGVDYLCRVLP